MLEEWSATSMRVKDAKMFTHKQLTLLAASVIAAGLFLAQPARALTVIAQSYLVSSWDGGNAGSLSVGADAIPIAMDGVFTAHAPPGVIVSPSRSPAHMAPHNVPAMISPGVATSRARIARRLGSSRSGQALHRSVQN